ncbi:hypothetical protein ACXX9E_29750 [Pseudomonas sp. GNP014]
MSGFISATAMTLGGHCYRLHRCAACSTFAAEAEANAIRTTKPNPARRAAMLNNIVALVPSRSLHRPCGSLLWKVWASKFGATGRGDQKGLILKH